MIGKRRSRLGVAPPARPEAELAALREEFDRFAPYRVAARLDGRTAKNHPEVETALFERWRRGLPSRLDATGRPAFELARGAIALVRSLLVTQRQVDYIDILDSFEDGLLLEPMTVLVSGLANCELVNFVVWRALRDAGHQAHLFETGDADAVGGNHLLLYVLDDTGAAFVDAWSDVPLFHLEDYVPAMHDLPWRQWRPLKVRSRRRPPGVPTHAELAATHTIKSHGLYPESCFRQGLLRTHSRPKTLAINDPEPRDPSSVAEVWRDYVAMRALHIDGQLDDPAAAYDAFARRDDLPEPLRATVEALAERQRENQDPEDS